MTVVLRQFLQGSSGKLIKNPETFRKQKNDTEEYDYIIVGGGMLRESFNDEDELSGLELWL